MKGGVVVCGTGSDVGKSHVVTGLCRLLARQGVRVAPFKAQNMSLNSWVTAAGEEIGRAQGVQALAAGAEPEAAMNPVLLKPTGERSSQVVFLGHPISQLDTADYHAGVSRLRPGVLDALADLRARFDVVIAEGAGGCAEINLLGSDLANLPLARDAGLPAVVVGDIERGGVFASLYGSLALLPPDLRSTVHATVINRFRGDPALLGDGPAELARRSGVPGLGVLPFLDGVSLDAEDSLALAGPPPRPVGPRPAARLDVAVVRFPRLANATDLDPLYLEPGVEVRLVASSAQLGRPDLVILPGTKETVGDLAWLRREGFDQAIEACGAAAVLGICGGQQMMGRTITDHVESGLGAVAGLGWLDVTTEFHRDKVVRRRRGHALGRPVHGYEIHHGVTRRGEEAGRWIDLRSNAGVAGDEGASGEDGRYLGTALHGLFEADAFREAFLADVARRRGRSFGGGGVDFAQARQAQADRLADACAEHLDLAALERIIEQGSPGRAVGTRAEPGSFARARRVIRAVDTDAGSAAAERQRHLAKPPGSLGELEDLGARLAAMARTCPPPVPVPAAVAVFAADHGVHAQGVTPWPQSVTAAMVDLVANGGAAINVLANQMGASVTVVDVGVAARQDGSVPSPSVLDRRVRIATADLATGPALSLDEVERALDVGAEVAERLVAAGARCLVTGDLGLANTTASAAVIAALTGRESGALVGRGSGADDAVLVRKRAVVERACARLPATPAPMMVLAEVGGLEIAALAGFIVGGAAAGLPVVVDGVVSGAALLAAVALVPEALGYCVAGHRSTEPAARAVLDHLALRPVLDLDLRLGEGTGACLALPVLEAAARILAEMATLADAGVTGTGVSGARPPRPPG